MGQKLDKIDTNAQAIAGAINFSNNTSLHSNLNMLTTGRIICNKFSTTSSPILRVCYSIYNVVINFSTTHKQLFLINNHYIAIIRLNNFTF